jgi:hypothetical protein
MGEQVGDWRSSWLHRGTFGEPREIWANIEFVMGLSCQSLFEIVLQTHAKLLLAPPLMKFSTCP